jgi:hypothetical protein
VAQSQHEDDSAFVPITAPTPLEAEASKKLLLVGAAAILLIVAFVVVVAMTSRNKFSVAPNHADSAASSSLPAAETARPAVHVYNVSRVDAADARVAGRLRDAYWNATSDGRLEMPEVTVTTIYYDGRVQGEQDAAGEAALLIGAAVQPRTPALAGQPHGLIVLVTG